MPRSRRARPGPGRSTPTAPPAGRSRARRLSTSSGETKAATAPHRGRLGARTRSARGGRAAARSRAWSRPTAHGTNALRGSEVAGWPRSWPLIYQYLLMCQAWHLHHPARRDTRRSQRQIGGDAHRRTRAIYAHERRRHEVDRAADPGSRRDPACREQRPVVAQRQRADVVYGGGRGGKDEVLSALLDILGPAENAVRSVKIEVRFEHDAVRQPPRADRIVRAPDQRARPLSAFAEWLRRERGYSEPVQ